MTNKTINGVPRAALGWAIKQLAEDGNAGCGYFDSLTALLAAPDPIVEADGIGEPVAEVVGLCASCYYEGGAKPVVAYDKSHSWEAGTKLYSADQLAALQSTIAQLKAENERVNTAWHDMKRELDGEKAENERLRGGVKLPAKKSEHYSEEDCDDEYPEQAKGWNACLDELRRMNDLPKSSK